MAKGNGAIYGVGFLIVMVIVAAYAGAFNPATWAKYGSSPSTPGTTNPCAAYPGTTWDQATGSCKTSAPSNPYTPYHGSISFTIGTIDGDAKTALTLTAGLYWLMHADNSFAGSAPVIVAATTIPMSPTDNGHMILVFRYLTCTVGFIDADKSWKNNPSYMKSAMYLKDWDGNGQLDQTYDLDLTSLQLVAGQSVPVVSINMIAWNADTSVTITSVSVPTGMNTAGDYHATGYIAGITETSMWTLQKINLKSNTTASTKFGVKFAAGTTYIVAFTLKGIGAQTQAQYGQRWLKSEFYDSNYDAAQDEWAVYRAHNPVTGAVDVSQVNYGMPFVNERQSGTTWLLYDIWVHTTSDIVASATEVLEVELWCTNPAGTQTEATTNLTFTG